MQVRKLLAIAGVSIVAVLVGRTVWKHLGGDPSAPPPIALRIESKPPAAEVWWDGFPSGKVTPVTLAVDNGLPHALELRLAGLSPARIAVPAGQPEGNIALELSEAGAVEVHSDPPGAMVSMKNEPPCTTPCTVEVPAGSPAQLEMTRDGYLVETASFTVAGHSLARWTPRLRRSGTLEISSDPPSVIATVDGKPVGRTPLNVPVEAASPHQVA